MLDDRVFLRIFYACERKRCLEGFTIELIALQKGVGTEMGTSLQADVTNKGMGRRETQASSLVDGKFPADIPRDRRFIKTLQTRKDSSILDGIAVFSCHPFEGFGSALVVNKVLLPTVAPGSPPPT